MIKLVKLTCQDGQDIYEMLKGIDSVENSYSNPTYNMSFEDYKNWLIQQYHWDKGEELPEGYVAQSIYWLFDDDIPIGMGKIRHRLTAASREIGGNIGYAISKPFRGKGYGTLFLKLLLLEAKKMKLDEILLTVDKCNIPSKRICESNRGVLIKESSERWYFEF